MKMRMEKSSASHQTNKYQIRRKCDVLVEETFRSSAKLQKTMSEVTMTTSCDSSDPNLLPYLLSTSDERGERIT